MTIFPYTKNATLKQTATLGLIVLKADETIEHDFRRLIPSGVALHISRIESDLEVTAHSLVKMKDRLTTSANLFSDSAQFDCVGYACTSGTSVIGVQNVEDRIIAGCNTNHVTNPVSALIAACGALGAKRIAILSPYVEDVSLALRSALKQADIDAPIFGSFNTSDEAEVVRIDEASIINAAITLTQDKQIDALFISCTNLRALGTIAPIEQTIKKPVLTSNQVLAWHMAKLTGFVMCNHDEKIGKVHRT